MSLEAGALIGLDGAVLYWHVPGERTAASLPDSRDLWCAFWENRDRIKGFAHSHPGRGVPEPSGTDLTTFAAIESALGARIEWWIVSEDEWVACRWVGPGKLDYSVEVVFGAEFDFLWIDELRAASGWTK